LQWFLELLLPLTPSDNNLFWTQIDFRNTLKSPVALREFGRTSNHRSARKQPISRINILDASLVEFSRSERVRKALPNRTQNTAVEVLLPVTTGAHTPARHQSALWSMGRLEEAVALAQRALVLRLQSQTFASSTLDAQLSFAVFLRNAGRVHE
jgi:hypothetical protein